MELTKDTGSKQYSDEEQRLLYDLTSILHLRGKAHHMNSESVKPHDYIYIYAKAAAAMYETARALAIESAQSRCKTLSVLQWLEIIGELDLSGMTYSNKLLGVQNVLTN